MEDGEYDAGSPTSISCSGHLTKIKARNLGSVIMRSPLYIVGDHIRIDGLRFESTKTDSNYATPLYLGNGEDAKILRCVWDNDKGHWGLSPSFVAWLWS